LLEGSDSQLSMLTLEITSLAGLDTEKVWAGEFKTLRLVNVPEDLILI